MGLWSIITGATKTADVIDAGIDLTKTAAKGLDVLIYTDEEKAIAGAKSVAVNMAQALEFAKLMQGETGASAVTRRIVACIVMANFSIFALTSLVFLCIGKKVLVADIVSLASSLMIGEITMSVVVAMFGYYAWTKGKK